MYVCSPQQEAQSVFPAKYLIKYATAKAEVNGQISLPFFTFSSQLLGLGLSVISDIDPSPDNFFSAGVVNTTAVLVDCLVRLEHNRQTKVSVYVRVCACVCVCVYVCMCVYRGVGRGRALRARAPFLCRSNTQEPHLLWSVQL